MIKNYLEHKPVIADTCFIAETADVVGRVTIGENSSVWFGAVVRADVNEAIIGKNCNIQDNAVLHQSALYPVVLKDNVTVGHSAIVHACVVGDNVLVGMGAIILDGAEIGENCIIGANALITGGTKIPAGSMVLGSPAKVVRSLTEEEIALVKDHADRYVIKANEYKEG